MYLILSHTTMNGGFSLVHSEKSLASTIIVCNCDRDNN